MSMQSLLRLRTISTHFSNEEVNDIDGVKIDFKDSWVHLRKSNTEPIIRIYSEANTMKAADELAESVKKIINDLK